MKDSETLSTALYIVLGVLAAVAINAGMGFALGTDLPIVAVQSGSMVPAFYKGDLLILEGMKGREGSLQAGDVIVFSPPGREVPVVHRIIALNPDGTFQTKGDANPTQLPFEKGISADQIHGRSIITIPYLGWVKIAAVDAYFYAVANPMLAAIALAGLLLAFFAWDKLEKKGKKRK
ncbi:MAG: signal peptidase I [Candidatus Aenigmarchaeota archaeon]|nr:signal peptidase I [Candidatus Aenigmarchaeota archaeon]